MLSQGPSPSLVVVVCVLVLAVAGSAVAGTDGLSSKVNRSKVRKIARKQIHKLEPGLSVANAKSAQKAKTATNATNFGGKPASAYLETTADTIGRSGFAADCDPSSTTFVGCVSVPIALARQSNLLINANMPFGGDGAVDTDQQGTCRVSLDGATLSNTAVHVGIRGDGTQGDADNVGAGVTKVAGPLGAGSYTLVLECNEGAGNIDFNDLTMSVLAIGSK